MLCDLLGHLFVRNRGGPPRRILRVDPGVNRLDGRVVLREVAPRVLPDPQRDSRRARPVGHIHRRRAVQQRPRVEDVVDLLVLHRPVRVDARRGGVEGAADERLGCRDRVLALPLHVLRDLGDRRRVHAVEPAHQPRVLEHQPLQRGVAGPLAVAEQGAVGGGASVQPGRAGVDQDLVEVVVAVPLQPRGRHAGVMGHGMHEARDAARRHRAGVGDAVPHRVAQP